MGFGQYPTLLSPREVGKILRRSEKTLETWRREGRGPAFHRVERRILYLDSDVYAFIESGRQATGQARD